MRGMGILQWDSLGRKQKKMFYWAGNNYVCKRNMQQIWFWHVIQVYFYSMAGDFFLFKIILCRCSQLMQKYYWNIPVICLCPSCAILHTLYMSSFPNGITHLEIKSLRQSSTLIKKKFFLKVHVFWVEYNIKVKIYVSKVQSEEIYFKFEISSFFRWSVVVCISWLLSE